MYKNDKYLFDLSPFDIKFNIKGLGANVTFLYFLNIDYVRQLFILLRTSTFYGPHNNVNQIMFNSFNFKRYITLFFPKQKRKDTLLEHV